MKGPAEEIMDRVDLPLADTQRALRDLGRVNSWLLGNRALRAVLLPRLLGTESASTVLDVAAGAGDGLASACRAAERRGARVRVVSSDRKLSHLLIGRRTGSIDQAVVCVADELPFGDGAFDCCVSTLFFHHLDDAGKKTVAAEMGRVARRAVLIVDLERSRWAAWALRLFFPLLGIGRIAYVDGLVSLASSWTLEEWRDFLPTAPIGEPSVEVRRHFPARLSVVLGASVGGR